MLVTFCLAEDRRSWQDHLHHCAVHVVLKHHGQTLLVAAGAAVARTRTSLVLWAAHAGLGLLVLGGSIRTLAVVGSAVGCRSGSIGVPCSRVELAADLWRGLDNDDIQVAVINGGDLFAVVQQAEHTAFDGDALTAVRSAASEGQCGV